MKVSHRGKRRLIDFLSFPSWELRVTKLFPPLQDLAPSTGKWKCPGNKGITSLWSENNTERASGHIPDSGALEVAAEILALSSLILPIGDHFFPILAASGCWSVTIVSASYCQPGLMFLPECLGKKHSGKSPLISLPSMTSHLIFNIDLQVWAAIMRNTKQGRG